MKHNYQRKDNHHTKTFKLVPTQPMFIITKLLGGVIQGCEIREYEILGKHQDSEHNTQYETIDWFLDTPKTNVRNTVTLTSAQVPSYIRHWS